MHWRTFTLIALSVLSFSLISCGAGERERDEAKKREEEAERLRHEAAMEEQRAKETRVMEDIKQIDLAVMSYHFESGQRFYPTDLKELTVINRYAKIFLKAEVIRDPWGEPYHYNLAGDRNIAAGDPKPDIWCERDGYYFCNWKTGKQTGAVPR